MNFPNCNLTFYQNVCHVCKKYSTTNGIHLKRCARCQMISYCCKEHQLYHWPVHKNLCNAVKDIAKQFREESCNITERKWMQLRLNFLMSIFMKQNNLKRRSFDLCEKQIIKYVRACPICYEQTSSKLIDCKNCVSTSFCESHKDFIHPCNQLKLCFELDVLLADDINAMFICMNYLKYISHDKNMENIQDFIDIKTLISCNSNNMSPRILIALHTEFYTRSLTVYHGLKVLNYVPENRFTIHILQAKTDELQTMHAWELLLHLIPSIMILEVVLIGKYQDLILATLFQDLCNNCILQKKRLLFQFYQKDYISYTSSLGYKQPNLIIIYNMFDFIKEKNRDLWTKYVQTMKIKRCPVIFCCHTEEEAQQVECKVKCALCVSIRYLYLGRNAFASLRPYRNTAFNDLFELHYQNEYIIIYKSLYLKRSKSKSKN